MAASFLLRPSEPTIDGEPSAAAEPPRAAVPAMTQPSPSVSPIVEAPEQDEPDGLEDEPVGEDGTDEEPEPAASPPHPASRPAVAAKPAVRPTAPRPDEETPGTRATKHGLAEENPF